MEEINNDNYPPNKKEKEVASERKLEKVVTGKVVKKKKGFFGRLSETFFGDDSSTVGSYILWDVLIPAAKNTISDMVTTGIEMILFGEGRSSRGIRRDRSRSYVSYTDYYKRGERDRDRDRVRTKPNSFEDVVIESRGEAEEVLERLVEMIETYDVVTVADYYDLVGIDSSYTDNKYGWTNLNRANVARVREGYVVSLPRPYPLD